MDYKPLPVGISDYKHVSCHGTAFCGKECVVHCSDSEDRRRLR